MSFLWVTTDSAETMARPDYFLVCPGWFCGNFTRADIQQAYNEGRVKVQRHQP